MLGPIFIPAIDSSCTAAMYDLEKNYPEQVFYDGIASYPCVRII
jgi:hypothetical protein